MTTNELSEAGKAEMEAGRAAKERSLREFAERTKGKPTPTQEENDEAAAGKSFVGIEHGLSALAHLRTNPSASRASGGQAQTGAVIDAETDHVGLASSDPAPRAIRQAALTNARAAE